MEKSKSRGDLTTTALWPRKVYAHIPGKAPFWPGGNPQIRCRVQQPLENQIQRSRRLAHSDLCLRHWRKVPSPGFATVDWSFVFHSPIMWDWNAKLGSEPKLIQYQKDNNKDIQRLSSWFLSEEANDQIHLSANLFSSKNNYHIVEWHMMTHDGTRHQWFASTHPNHPPPWYPRMREPRWKLVAGACGSLPHCAPEHKVTGCGLNKTAQLCLDISFISFLKFYIIVYTCSIYIIYHCVHVYNVNISIVCCCSVFIIQ